MTLSLKRKHIYDYARPALTVDVVIATQEEKPRVLLIRRRHDPFKGAWALPGGFVDEDEPLETAALRELFEETGVKRRQLEQLHTFGEPGRDPRGWTVSVVYLARVKLGEVKARAADDAAAVDWHRLDRLPSLAFDHAEILAYARRRLREEQR